MERDLDFLKQHHKELAFLIKKGWLIPQGRLIAGEKINQWAGSLNAIRFTIAPESTQQIGNKYFFKESKIILEVDAILDKNIYDLTINILKNFPGVLILRKFSIRRNEQMNEINLLALKKGRRPNFVASEIIFEWFAMGDKDEK